MRSRQGGDTLPDKNGGVCRLGRIACAVMASCCFLLAGCPEQMHDDKGANQSLVEIGELSLEQGEALESEGRKAEANVAYRRALWAFRYHEKLTSEQPFLLDEALDGIKRTTPTAKR